MKNREEVMAESGLLKIVKELEKDLVDFVEEEVQELEGAGGKKSKYSERFQGDVLGKHDPYGEDAGDHEAHALESGIPDPEHGAEWFPAVSGIKAGKTAARQTGSKGGLAGAESLTRQASINGDDSAGDAAQFPLKPASAPDPQETLEGSLKIKKKTDNAGMRGEDAADAETRAAGQSKGSDLPQGNDVRRGGGSSSPTDNPTSSSEEGTEGEPKSRSETARGTSDSNMTSAERKELTKAPPKAGKSSGEDMSPEDSHAPLEDNSDLPEREAFNSSQEIERETFRRKAPILVADLREVSRKGKKAKEKKEILRGIRRTLEKPHKLYRDPKRLIAARSGDPQQLHLSLKRHGRSIETIDDSDPQDISADPSKLESVRSNHRLAIRHMIDMGQQYGKDPFEGIDPADVQAVVEHHAAEHPHRKHKLPYRPRRSVGEESLALENDGNHHRRGRGVDPSNDEDLRFGDEGGEAFEGYPKLREARDIDIDTDFPRGHRLTHRRKKRRYPQPYRNDDNPNDLQLAADSLQYMADQVSDDYELSEDAPLHRKRAHAAKKMLRCINRVRSFQEDPAACEGAFIDEASEEGVDIGGLSPDEIESRYYTLKKVSAHYEKKKKHRHSKDTENGRESDTSYRGAHHGSYSSQKKHTHHKNHHSQHYERGRGSSEDEIYDSENSGHHKKHSHHKKHFVHYEDAGQDAVIGEGYPSESSDIEMNLPQNQFPDASVYPKGAEGDVYVQVTASNGLDDDQSNLDNNDDNEGDLFDEIGGAISTIFSDDEEAVSEVAGAAQGIEKAAAGAEQAVEGVESAVGEAEKAVEGVESAVGKAEQAAEGVEKAVGEISEVEGELSKVESIGAEAETAAEDIEGMENAEGDFAKMLNFCSNPIDNLTKGDNLLSGIGDLAKNPDEVINQADSLIGAGAAAVKGIATGSSGGDMLGSIMGMVSQLAGGGDNEAPAGDSDDNPNEGSNLSNRRSMEMTGQFASGEDPSAERPEGFSKLKDSSSGNTSEDPTPSEFENAELYGDEYN